MPPEIDYRQKSIQEFGLKPCLEEQQTSPSTKRARIEDKADNLKWKRYYEYRCKHNNMSAPKQAPGSSPCDDDEEDECAELLKKVVTRFRQEARKIGGDGAQDFCKSTTYMVVTDCTWDPYSSNELRTASYRSVVFSSYQIAQAIEFSHRYHKRVGYSRMEYSVWWAFSLVRFDGEGPGDAIQQRLAKNYPKGGFILPDDEYNGEDQSEYLCSNCCLDPPSEEKGRWQYVENQDFHNLTPSTVTRIREWLYGTPHFKSRNVILSDLDLMRLVFASMGSPKLDVLYGDVGHTWATTPEHPATVHLQEAGYLEKEWDHYTHVSWLEYAVRVGTQSLRPIDMYYAPYDQKAAKGEWGSIVLNEYDQMDAGADGERQYYGDDEDDDRALQKQPWLIWDREKERGRLTDSVKGLARLMASMSQR